MNSKINVKRLNENTRIILQYLIENTENGEIETSINEIAMENDIKTLVVIKNLKILENAGYIMIYMNYNTNFKNLKIKLLNRG